MKIVGYCRVSTDMQGDYGYSLAAQTDRIRTWVRERRAAILEIHTDTISGYRADNRPGLKRALELACKEQAALVVCSLSRLARSTRDALEIMTRLDESGADLISLSESIDTTHAAGKMVFRLLSVLAEFERDLISERIKAVFRFMRSQGKITGTIPFGFNARNGYLVENKREQEIIRCIIRLKKRGYGYKRLAQALIERGMRGKMGHRHWSQGTLWKLLRRYGLLKLPKSVVPAIFYAHGQASTKIEAVAGNLPRAETRREHAKTACRAGQSAVESPHARKLGTGTHRAKRLHRGGRGGTSRKVDGGRKK